MKIMIPGSPEQAGEILFSDELRDKIWEHLPSVARESSNLVRAQFAVNDPRGFFNTEYDPEMEELRMTYTEFIYRTSPLAELLVRDLLDHVSLEESKTSGIDPKDLFQAKTERFACQKYCCVDGNTGEITHYSENTGTLSAHDIVETELEKQASSADTPEEAFSILFKAVLDPSLSLLDDWVNTLTQDKLDELLNVFKRI